MQTQRAVAAIEYLNKILVAHCCYLYGVDLEEHTPTWAGHAHALHGVPSAVVHAKKNIKLLVQWLFKYKKVLTCISDDKEKVFDRN